MVAYEQSSMQQGNVANEPNQLCTVPRTISYTSVTKYSSTKGNTMLAYLQCKGEMVPLMFYLILYKHKL